MYAIDKAELQNENVDFNLIKPFLQMHQMEIPRLNKLDRYYRGEHVILDRPKNGNQPNNRLVCNHAKYISDMANGYLLGEPVGYSGEGIDKLQDWLKLCDAPTKDMDLGKDCSVFGRAYELVYMTDGEPPHPQIAVIDPRNAFVIYSDTVDREPLIGVYYYPNYARDGQKKGFTAYIITGAQTLEVRCSDGFQQIGEATEKENQFFGGIPLIEYWNNEEQQGDFEQVISLIDAYNTLQSDRINDKEQFIDAILIMTGANLGDESRTAEAAKVLKAEKLLSLPQDARAEYLTRQLNETDVELLKRALEQDIHKLSNVPCLTDDNFVGNASGVAMKYKLLGFEQMAKTKERYFAEGLKKRVALFASVAQIKGMAAIDPIKVGFTFSRSLPANEPELAQTVATLQNIVPDEILLTLLPFVKDIPEAMNLLKHQKKEALNTQQASFGVPPPIKELDDEEK